MREALLIAQLYAAKIEHAILHRRLHALAFARHGALIERGDDAQRQMEPRAAVADLSAGDERRAFAEPGGRCRAAGALRDVLIDFAILVGTGAKAFDRGIDEPRIELL